MTTTQNTEPQTFANLGLNSLFLKTLEKIGYETPSPIQEQTIPLLLKGHDMVGQAQTGTGKTAAFALPLLSRLNVQQKKPQIIILTPTRELAIQVEEALQTYASEIKGFKSLAVYGGAGIEGQIRSLKKGVHAIVGTPGRIMDHMRRGTLDLSEIQAVVLDEADEMLRMGFVDDVEWILEHTPSERQTALFSATMPAPIRKIAKKYLNNPQEIKIKVKTETAETINQRFCVASGTQKMQFLTRILDAEDYDGVLVFVRTKHSTTKFADQLEAQGYRAVALSGDISQSAREKTVERLKAGKIDIVVATDVAARGLDVDRISHVINYDIPYDTETYVHRIGRTGRAGRTGEAILFVAPREKNLLNAIEKATKHKIQRMTLPTQQDIVAKQKKVFKQRLENLMQNDALKEQGEWLEEFYADSGLAPEIVAAALLKWLQQKEPNLAKPKSDPKPRREDNREAKFDRDDSRGRDRAQGRSKEKDKRQTKNTNSFDFETYKIELGKDDDFWVKDILNLICRNSDLQKDNIGHIDLFKNHSTVQLPTGMPEAVFKRLKKLKFDGKDLNLTLSNKAKRSKRAPSKKSARKKRA